MDKKKICLIGKFTPFQGGIPTHNYFLAKEILKTHNLFIIGFKRFYPTFIEEIKYKNKTNDLSKIEFLDQIKNVFVPYNFFSWKSTLNLIYNFQPDIVIIPWWYIYLAPSYIYILKKLNRQNIRSVILCHNVFLDSRYLFFSGFFNKIKKNVTKKVFNLSKNFIVPSEREKAQIESFHNNPHVVKSLHPVYDFTKSKFNCIKDNKTLNLLFFGYIRKNKGLHVLLDAIKLLKKEKIKLTILGSVANEKLKENYLQQVKDNGIENIINFIDKYATEEDMNKYFCNSDVVVLPYLEGTSSGVIATAYGFGKPVLVTNVGGLPEAVINNKTGKVVNKNNPDEIAKGIKWFINNKHTQFESNIQDFIEKNMSWNSLVNKLLHFINN